MLRINQLAGFGDLVRLMSAAEHAATPRHNLRALIIHRRSKTSRVHGRPRYAASTALTRSGVNGMW